jgi:hypothetical protein
MLASFRMWLSRLIWPARPGVDFKAFAVVANPRRADWVRGTFFIPTTTIDEFVDRQFQIFGNSGAAEINRAVLGEDYAVCFVRVELISGPLLVGRTTPHEAAQPTEAKV